MQKFLCLLGILAGAAPLPAQEKPEASFVIPFKDILGVAASPDGRTLGIYPRDEGAIVFFDLKKRADWGALELYRFTNFEVIQPNPPRPVLQRVVGKEIRFCFDSTGKFLLWRLYGYDDYQQVAYVETCRKRLCFRASSLVSPEVLLVGEPSMRVGREDGAFTFFDLLTGEVKSRLKASGQLIAASPSGDAAVTYAENDLVLYSRVKGTWTEFKRIKDQPFPEIYPDVPRLLPCGKRFLYNRKLVDFDRMTVVDRPPAYGYRATVYAPRHLLAAQVFDEKSDKYGFQVTDLKSEKKVWSAFGSAFEDPGGHTRFCFSSNGESLITIRMRDRRDSNSILEIWGLK